MNENVMSQLDAELEHAGEETALSPKCCSVLILVDSFACYS